MKLRGRLAKFLITVGIALAVLIGAFVVSPWPSALVVRALFERGGKATAAEMQKQVPSNVAGITDEPYGSGDDEILDVWFPAGTQDQRTTVLWVHGGGWIAGDKSDVTPYLKILAARGFTVIGINYSIAPGAKYPTPVRQTNMALTHVLSQAERYHVDPKKIVLAGDSAGSQIAGQVAIAATVPAYARKLGLSPATTQLAGMVLNCGAYDPGKLTTASSGIIGFFVRKVVDSYFDADDLSAASVTKNATTEFPPTWISGGNDDPLTPQGRAFVERLDELGVPVQSLFFPADYRPKLKHEYQFDLKTAAAQQALGETIAFLKGL